jgi:hypothetical protein
MSQLPYPCCRWADVLQLLYQLPLSCDGRSLGPWAVVIPYVSSDVFVGDDPELALYFELCVSVCVVWTKYFRYFYLNLVCNNYI